MDSPKVAGQSKRADKVWLNRKCYDTDFSNKDLTHADFRGSTLVNCNFDSSDLSYANFEGANCHGSTFRQSNLYHTSFKDADLTLCIIDPRNAYGATVSLTCGTFDRVTIGSNWMAAWLYYPLVATIPDDVRQDVKAMLLKMMTQEQLDGLDRHFKNRVL